MRHWEPLLQLNINFKHYLSLTALGTVARINIIINQHQHDRIHLAKVRFSHRSGLRSQLSSVVIYNIEQATNCGWLANDSTLIGLDYRAGIVSVI